VSLEINGGDTSGPSLFPTHGAYDLWFHASNTPSGGLPTDIYPRHVLRSRDVDR